MVAKLYTGVQNLSLDVVVGALATSHLVAVYFGVTLFWSHYVVLGSSVWLLYTIDHLLDAKQIQGKAVSSRHRFHQDYFTPILVVWLVVLVANTIISFAALPATTIRLGILVAGVALSHQVIIRLFEHKKRGFLYKEFRVAIGYSFGIFLGPLSMMETWPIETLPIVLAIFLLAFLNLLLFSKFDEEVDRQHGQISIATLLGRQHLDRVIQAMFILFGASVLLGALFSSQAHELVCWILIILAGLILGFIMKNSNHFSVNSRYRVLGDFVFLLPGLTLFLW